MKRFRHCALAALTTFSVAVALTARHGPDVDPGESVGPIGAREPDTQVKLAPEGGLTAVIPEGYRAMTVKAEVVGLSGFVMPGSFVDVVCVITPHVQQGGDPISKIVLQSIKVLASGGQIDRPRDERDTLNARAVTLQVTPEQAEKLALAASEGKLQLVMRNYIDRDDARMLPPAPQRNSVEVIEGTKRRNVEFP